MIALATLLACAPSLDDAGAVAEALRRVTPGVAEADGGTLAWGAIGGWSATRTVTSQEDATCENGQGEPYACTRVALTADATVDALVDGRWWTNAEPDADAAWSDTPPVPEPPDDAVAAAPSSDADVRAVHVQASVALAGTSAALQAVWTGDAAVDAGAPAPFTAYLRLSDTWDVYRVTLRGRTWQWDQAYSSR